MSSEEHPDIVELRIPSKPEFVGVARLSVLGIAGRMHFSYDEVEDIRLAVGEACKIAVDRAVQAGKADSSLDLRAEIYGNKLTIEIADAVGRHSKVVRQPSSPEQLDEQSLGALLMELLVDEFSVEDTAEGGTLVRMVKYAG